MGHRRLLRHGANRLAHGFHLGRVLINRDCSAIAGCRKRRAWLALDAQAIFFRRRHQPRRPPLTAAADERSAKVAEDAVTFLKDGHRVSAKRSLVLPEIAEPLGRKFAISNRVLDVLMAEIVLQRPRIHTLIGQLEPS
jgi:hypothetical protein